MGRRKRHRRDSGGYCQVQRLWRRVCIYPWYTLSSSGAFSYGVDYPQTKKDFHQANQFSQTTQCGGPFGANSTYCSTVLK